MTRFRLRFDLRQGAAICRFGIGELNPIRAIQGLLLPLWPSVLLLFSTFLALPGITSAHPAFHLYFALHYKTCFAACLSLDIPRLINPDGLGLSQHFQLLTLYSITSEIRLIISMNENDQAVRVSDTRLFDSTSVCETALPPVWIILTTGKYTIPSSQLSRNVPNKGK